MSESQTESARIAAEFAKLGVDGQARSQRAANQITAIVGRNTEEFAAIESITTTAAGITAMEKLLARGGTPPGDLSLAELQRMQREPDYMTNPAKFKKVGDGYAELARRGMLKRT
jgi:hypothetical protein